VLVRFPEFCGEGMKKITRVGALILLALSLASGVLGQTSTAVPQPNSQDNEPAVSAPGKSAPVSNSPYGADYVIGADDMLHISVWKEPDLTVSLPVRPDGKISLPLLDDVTAAGLTPMHLANEITTRLKKFIADPRVTVVVTAMNSQRIFVTGEVVHSGPVPLLPNMTVLQALSAAGFNQFSNLKGIYLLRMDNGKQVKLPFNYKEVVKGKHPEQNIQLRPGDTVVVP
jgi:polysaccharide export outer membrane protein